MENHLRTAEGGASRRRCGSYSCAIDSIRFLLTAT